MNELITINTKEITRFAEEGGKFVFKADAEQELEKLLNMQKMLEEAIENVKQSIMDAGTSISPNFKGVRGHRIDCTMRKYGSKYKYHFDMKNTCKPFLKHKDYYTVDADSVDKYYEEVGELPEGIMENEREDKMVISYKEEE